MFCGAIWTGWSQDVPSLVSYSETLSEVVEMLLYAHNTPVPLWGDFIGLYDLGCVELCLVNSFYVVFSMRPSSHYECFFFICLIVNSHCFVWMNDECWFHVSALACTWLMCDGDSSFGNTELRFHLDQLGVRWSLVGGFLLLGSFLVVSIVCLTPIFGTCLTGLAFCVVLLWFLDVHDTLWLLPVFRFLI